MHRGICALGDSVKGGGDVLAEERGFGVMGTSL